MTQELTTTNGSALAQQLASRAQFEILRKAVAPDLTDAELQFVAGWCQHARLSPFLKHIHVWKQNGKINYQVSIDGARAIGMRTGKFRGRLGPFWCGPDGAWHDVWLKEEAPAAAKVGILWDGLLEPTWGVCRIAGYAARSGAGPLWKTIPDVMGAKVAEMIAWRVVCPVDMGGVYTSGELPDEPTEVTTWATPEQIARIREACRLLAIEGPDDEAVAEMTYDEAEELILQYRREWTNRQTKTPEEAA